MFILINLFLTFFFFFVHIQTPSIQHSTTSQLAILTDGRTDMEKPTLPQDIMLLICQELGARREFTTLYRCSMVSRRIASIAVEQLYRLAIETLTTPSPC